MVMFKFRNQKMVSVVEVQAPPRQLPKWIWPPIEIHPHRPDEYVVHKKHP